MMLEGHNIQCISEEISFREYCVMFSAIICIIYWLDYRLKQLVISSLLHYATKKRKKNLIFSAAYC